MDVRRCWPYEELKVEKLGDDPRAFRFQTPWHSSVVRTTEEGAALFELLFLSNAELPPEELIEAYSLALSPISDEPFVYILPETSFTSAHDEISGDVGQNLSWTWDAETALALSQIPGTQLYSPRSLLSVMRRYFFLEASERDRTRDLYSYLKTILPSRAQGALAFMITQNLSVTQRCDEVLSAALPRAGAGEESLMDFICSEKGHDRIMGAALKEFEPTLTPSWAMNVHPATATLMDAFKLVAENHFLAFAFTVALFERPHAEKSHPITSCLRQYGFHRAADRYERHHEINDEGHHDQIGMDLIREMAPVTREYAEQALRWGEFMTRAVTAHSAMLLEFIQAREDGLSGFSSAV